MRSHNRQQQTRSPYVVDTINAGTIAMLSSVFAFHGIAVGERNITRISVKWSIYGRKQRRGRNLAPGLLALQGLPDVRQALRGPAPALLQCIYALRISVKLHFPS